MKNSHDRDWKECEEQAQENLPLELHPAPQLEANPHLIMPLILHLDSHPEGHVSWGCHGSIDVTIMLGLRAPIQVDIRGLEPQGWVNLKTYVLQDTEDEESKKKVISLVGRIMIWSNHVQDHLTIIKLMAKKNDVNKLSKRFMRVGEKHGKKLCWLGEANDKDVRRKKVRNTTKKGLNCIKLPSHESLNL